MTTINYSNERVIVDSELIIGTLKLTANVERKGGKLSRVFNGNITEEGAHKGSFNLEENGYLYSNVVNNDIAAVWGAIATFISSLESDTVI